MLVVCYADFVTTGVPVGLIRLEVFVALADFEACFYGKCRLANAAAL
jgi:hypothetical protein